MGRQPIQLSILAILVAVALAALNLGAVIAVSKFRPRELVLAERDAAHFKGPLIKDYPLYTLTCRFPGSMPPGTTFREVDRVLQGPLPETFLQIWSPAIASASATLLIMGLSLSSPLSIRRRARIYVTAESRAVPSGGLHVNGCGTVLIALVGLNFAAAVYRPPRDASGSEVAREYFNRSGAYLMKADGAFEYLRRHWDLVFARSRDAVPPEPHVVSIPASCNGEGEIIKVTTIEDKDDGSVLGYWGRPGEVTSSPVVLRHPLRSPLQMWWPLAASTSITVLVGFVLWRRARLNRSDRPERRVNGHLTRATMTRSLMGWAVAGTALVVLNSAGAHATWDAQLRGRISRVKLVERFHWGVSLRDEVSGDVRFGFGSLATGEELIRVMTLPRRPTVLQIIAPVLATSSITLPVFMVLLGHSDSRRRRGDPRAAGANSRRGSRLQLLRLGAVAAGLIGLNVAGAVYGPFPEPGDEQPCPAVFNDPAMVSHQREGHLFRDRANRVMRRLSDSGGEVPATAVDYPLPLHGYDGATHRGGARVLDSVVYRSDGSVVAYDGNPGFLDRLLSRPRVIRPPTRSFLEVWWSLIGSLSISLIVIGILWCQARRRFPEPESHGDAGRPRGVA